jgi:hypothetical protein
MRPSRDFMRGRWSRGVVDCLSVGDEQRSVVVVDARSARMETGSVEAQRQWHAVRGPRK